jgi:tetratricopeptide (TPR) repeat protein
MRNPTEEPAQLAALTEFLRPCAALVTFNGKAFDAPLLNTRYILNGQRSPLPGMAHLDLLPLARRLWRDRLPSRRLTSLERDILLLERTTEDVPGFLIPQLYFDYLRGGDARPLSGVFYHNRLDVVAMAALLNQMAQMLADPLGEAVEFALDLIAIGKAFEAAGQLEEAARLFAAGLNRPDLPEAHYWETQERLSLLEKRRENWEAALAVWRMAAEGRRIYAHVELAKYYEHKTRDYPAALHWTEAALALLHRPTAGRAERAQWLAELQHRQERLQRKVTQPK